MVSKEHQEKIVANITKINTYLSELGIFGGNAALNHIFAENHKIKKAVLSKKYKEAIKIMDSIMEYIRGLQWFKGNAALMWTLESLETTKKLINEKEKEPEPEPKPEYDEPTPSEDPKSEPDSVEDP